jgi:hypothetical protein
VNDEVSDGEEEVSQVDDDLANDRLSPTTVDLTTQPYERALPPAQPTLEANVPARSTLERTTPIKRIPAQRPSAERPTEPVKLRAPTSPSGRVPGLPLPAPEAPLTPVPVSAAPEVIMFDPSTAAVGPPLMPELFALPQAAVVAPRAPSVRPILRPHRTRAIAIGVAAFAVLVTLISVMALSTSSEAPTAQPGDAVVAAAPSPPAAPSPAPVKPAPAPALARPAAHAGTVMLHVITEPDGATVVLDGVRLGVTPFSGAVNVRPGQAWLKVRKRGFIAKKTRVSFEHEIEWDVSLRRLSHH